MTGRFPTANHVTGDTPSYGASSSRRWPECGRYECEQDEGGDEDCSEGDKEDMCELRFNFVMPFYEWDFT